RGGRARTGRGPGPGRGLLRRAGPGGPWMSRTNPRIRETGTPSKLRLGGMALRNGLLVHGPTHWAAAVRTGEGEIAVASGRKPDIGSRAAERVPGLRGVLKLAEAVAVIPLVKRALP